MNLRFKLILKHIVIIYLDLETTKRICRSKASFSFPLTIPNMIFL